LHLLPVKRPVRWAYQPPANSTFLSEQTSHQQSASSTFLLEQISTSHQHQPNEQAESEVVAASTTHKSGHTDTQSQRYEIKQLMAKLPQTRSQPASPPPREAPSDSPTAST
jgi:competence CoiA-like predicted nuclease